MSGFTHSASKTEDWVNPVAGIYAHYRIDDKWFVNAEGDGGGVTNSATAQGLGAVGYNWTQSIATTLGYRVLYTYDKARQRRERQLSPSAVDVRAFRGGQIHFLNRSPELRPALF